MISVPDAALFPIAVRPVRRSNSSITSRRKAVRKQGKRLRQMDPGHFPVAGGRVLARRRQRAAPVIAFGMIGLRQLRHRLQIPQPEPAEIRNVESSLANDVAQRVAARVSISGRIGHFPHAHAVQHDPDDAFEHDAQYYQDIAAVAFERSAFGVQPKVCLKAAIYALTLEYPDSSAAWVTDLLSTSRRIDSSNRAFCLQRP